MNQIGFVGAGRMGAPMVRRLVQAGHEVRALGRSVEKRRAVSELGAQPVTAERATPESFAAFMRADVGKWAPVIKAAGVYAD